MHNSIFNVSQHNKSEQSLVRFRKHFLTPLVLACSALVMSSCGGGSSESSLNNLQPNTAEATATGNSVTAIASSKNAVAVTASSKKSVAANKTTLSIASSSVASTDNTDIPSSEESSEESSSTEATTPESSSVSITVSSAATTSTQASTPKSSTPKSSAPKSSVPASSKPKSSTPTAASSSSVAANAPNITAATINANTVTINGVNFGQKAQAAPLLFEDFDNRTAGALPSDFGYYKFDNVGNGSTTVDGSGGYSGNKSLKHQSAIAPVSTSTNVSSWPYESFPHIGVHGFSTTTLYISYRLKFTTNGSKFSQLKFNRSGMESNGDCYHSQPKFRSSYYPSGSGLGAQQGGVEVKTPSLFPNGGYVNGAFEGWIGETKGFEGAAYVIPENTWVQVEEYYRLNDVGQLNGEFYTYVNGRPHFNFHKLGMRTLTSEVISCSYLVIGMDYYINTANGGISVWYDDHYLDTSHAHLALANAATWSQASVRSPQPASVWQDGTVSAQLKTAGFTAGSTAWLYIVRADGTVSSGWPVTLP